MTVYVIKQKSRMIEDINHIFNSREKAIAYIEKRLLEWGEYFVKDDYWSKNCFPNRDYTFEEILKIINDAYPTYRKIMKARKEKKSWEEIWSTDEKVRDYQEVCYNMYDRSACGAWGKEFKTAYDVLQDIKAGKQSIFKTKFLDEYMYPYTLE